MAEKNVLYISYDGMTDPLGQSQVIPYIQGLTKAGYRFTILSFEKKERFLRNGAAIRALLDASGISWEPQLFSTRPPVLSKIYDVWKMKRAVAKLHRQKKFSLVHCRSYIPASAGLELYRKTCVPFLFDMRGFWVDERVDNGQWDLSKPLFKRAYSIYKKKEKEYLNAAGHIISLTYKGRDELVANYRVPANKITVIPCCADLEHFDYQKINAGQQQVIRQQLGISTNDRIITYLGSLGGWYLTGEMLDFFRVMKAKLPAARMLFITHDPKEKILAAAAERGIQAADIIVQPAGRNEVPGFLSVSDWSLFFIKDAYSKKASSPTKQAEIMAMGIPLVCNDIGDTGLVIRESNAGVVVDELNDQAYARACDQLDRLLTIPKESIRAAARKYYDLNTGLNEFRTVYDKLTK